MTAATHDELPLAVRRRRELRLGPVGTHPAGVPRPRRLLRRAARDVLRLQLPHDRAVRACRGPLDARRVRESHIVGRQRPARDQLVHRRDLRSGGHGCGRPPDRVLAALQRGTLAGARLLPDHRDPLRELPRADLRLAHDPRRERPAELGPASASGSSTSRSASCSTAASPSRSRSCTSSCRTWCSSSSRVSARSLPGYLEAAQDLGAGAFTRWRKVILPLIAAPLATSFLFVFILSAADYVTPQFLGGTDGSMLGVRIQQALIGTGDWPLGAALAFLMLAAFMTCYLLTAVGLRVSKLDRIRFVAMTRDALSQPGQRGRSPILALVFLFVPLILMVLFSFHKTGGLSFPFTGFSLRWYREVVRVRELPRRRSRTRRSSPRASRPSRSCSVRPPPTA